MANRANRNSKQSLFLWLQRTINEKHVDAWAHLADAVVIGAGADLLLDGKSGSFLWLIDIAGIIVGLVLGYQFRRLSKYLQRKEELKRKRLEAARSRKEKALLQKILIALQNPHLSAGSNDIKED